MFFRERRSDQGHLFLANALISLVVGRASVLEVDFSAISRRNAVFRAKLARHGQSVLAQAKQSAACNAAHMLEARLSPWLSR
jgi:hypothetical protein